MTIKILLLPPFMKKHMEDGNITNKDLFNMEKLSSILSGLSVSKIRYLNNKACPDGGVDAITSRTMNMFDFTPFEDYVGINNDIDFTMSDLAVGNLLNALTDVGNEKINPSLSKNLHNYALRFKPLRVSKNTYVVVFDYLEEVDSPLARRQHYLNDMESLIKLIAIDIDDAELLDNSIYQNYLSLLQKNT